MSGNLLMVIKRRLAPLLRRRGSRKLCSRVADESTLPAGNTEINDLEEYDNGNGRAGNMTRGGVLCLLMKVPVSAFACLIGNLKEPSLDTIEEQISRERMRNSGLQMWFAGEPTTSAERNQLLVDSSMKYAIFL